MSISVLVGDNFVELLPKILRSVMEKGELTSPRHLPTLEVRPLVIKIQNPHHRFVDQNLINYPLTIMKQAQWLAGAVDMRSLQRFDPRIVNLIDPQTGLYDGAYGPKIRPQLEFAFNLLQNDPDSRRAIISIFQMSDQRDGLDIPTTLALQFLLRSSKLDMISYMRSNDIWRGLPTDVHLFTFLQEVMAAWLSVELGDYTHVAGSGHIYESSVDDIELWLDSPVVGRNEATPPVFRTSFEDTHKEAEQFLRWESSLSTADADSKAFIEPIETDQYLKWGAAQVLEYYHSQTQRKK